MNHERWPSKVRMSGSTQIGKLHCNFRIQPFLGLAAPELVIVMKDSPQPHWPFEFGLIKINSDLTGEIKIMVKAGGNR